MNVKKIALSSLLILGSMQAYSYDFEDSPSEMLAETEDFIALDSEIEALLEDEVFDEDMITGELGAHTDKHFRQYKEPSQEMNESGVYPLILPMQQVHIEEEIGESLDIGVDALVGAEGPMVIGHSISPLEKIQDEAKKSVHAIEINLRKVFSGSPVIYTVLFLLSTVSVCVWLYSMFTIRSVEFLPPQLVKDLRTKLISNQFDEALDLCVKQRHFFCKMLASGILARKHGLNVMLDTMKTEGKRSTISFWQRIGILNEIAIIAPMLGLLGTVLGMFYAFYDLNRSMESVSLLFDGLGISVGTTVAGLIVAILAMILHSMAKYRLVKILANVENEAQTFAALIDTRGPNI